MFEFALFFMQTHLYVYFRVYLSYLCIYKDFSRNKPIY